MKIRALQEFHVPGQPAFAAGEERVVDANLGAALVERGQAEEMRPEKPAAAKPQKKGEDKEK